MLDQNKVTPPVAVVGPDVARIMAGYERAVADRAAIIPLWRECYEYTLPDHAGWVGGTGFPSRARHGLYDGTAADAVDQLAASLLGHLAPPWGNWFGVVAAPGLVDLDLRVAVDEMAAQTTRVMQDEIDGSQLAVELHQAFLDLVVAGTGCLRLDPVQVGVSPQFSVQAVPLSEIVLGHARDDVGVRLYRRRRLMCHDLAGYSKTVSEYFQHSDRKIDDKYFDVIEFYDCSSDTGEHGVILIEDGAGPVLIHYEADAICPYIVFRWIKVPGEVWGRSPVMKALPDIKTANKVVELVLKNASIAVTGIWQAEDDGVLNPAAIDLVPGAIIPKAIGSAGLKPLEMPARFDVSQIVLSDLRARIRHALLADRFAPVEAGRMTATEVLTRSSEVALLLGAIYGRLQCELLTPLLGCIHRILRIRGAVPDLPLDGLTLALTHRSPLARAQAQQGIQPVLALIDAAGRMGSGAVQALDAPKILAYLAETIGVPEGLLGASRNNVT